MNQQAIRQRTRRRQALLSLFIVVLLGFFAVAFVHAELVADQQELDGIRSRIAEAEAHNAKVARAVEEASSPRAINSRAEDLGMVRSHQPVHLAAAAPVRDIPDTISFSGRQDQAPAIVAPATAADIAVAAGISGNAAVKSDSDIQDVASVAVDSASTGGLVAQAAPTQSADVSGSVSGTSVSVGAQTAPAVIATTATSGGAAVGTQTSIAGTRAVSTGQQQAGQQETATNRFGGTNAGTGNG